MRLATEQRAMTNAYRFVEAPKIEFFPAASENGKERAIYHSVIQRVPPERDEAGAQSAKRGHNSDESVSSAALIDGNYLDGTYDKADHLVGRPPSRRYPPAMTLPLLPQPLPRCEHILISCSLINRK